MFMFFMLPVSILLLPIFLIMGSPRLITTPREYLDTWDKFPLRLASRCPYLEMNARPWLKRLMEGRASAFTFLSFAVFAKDTEHNDQHEAVHVLQQAFWSPPFILFFYALGLLFWLPFRRISGVSALRASLLERQAYDMQDDA